MSDRPRFMIIEGTIPEGADPDDYEDGSWTLLPDDEQEEVRAWLKAERERRRNPERSPPGPRFVPTWDKDGEGGS